MVKTSIKNTAAATSVLEAVAVSNTVRPTLRVTSDRQNGELSYFVPVYSPGRKRKKKSVIIMSVTAYILVKVSATLRCEPRWDSGMTTQR